MLNYHDSLKSILELRPQQVAGFCDRELDAKTLAEELHAWRPFGRKGFCEYLGIGESTLSGWLKDGRIPQMAKNAFVLLLAHRRLQEEVRELRATLEVVRAKDLEVVRSGEHYQVCEFEEDEAGEVIGRVVADQVATIEDARLLASGHRAIRVQEGAEDLIQLVLEMADDPDYIELIEKNLEKIEAHKLRLTDYPEYEARFAKRTIYLDESIFDAVPASTKTTHAKTQADGDDKS